MEKKVNHLNSFNNSINNKKEKITYFKGKNHESKKKLKKKLTTILKPIDTFVNIATTSSSFTLSLTGIGLRATVISSSIACGLTIGSKVIYGIILQKYNKYKKQYEKDGQTIKSSDKLYRKFLQDNLIEKNQYGSLCNTFTKYVDETKNESLF